MGPAILVWALLSFRRITNTEERWPRSSGTVTCRELERYRARGVGDLYWPKIEVRYYVNEKEYKATFQWDAGYNFHYARETLDHFLDQGVIGIQYAPYDPRIVRIRQGKINNETWQRYVGFGSVGLVLSILSLLAIAGNLP